MSKIIFKEKQKFKQPWLWILLIGSTLISVIPFTTGLYKQLYLNQSWGNNPMSDIGLIITSISVFALMIGINILFCTMYLKTVITNNDITIIYFPIIRKGKVIKFSDIEDIYTREYRPVSEYGGWGIKGSEENRCYNTNGKFGIQIILKNSNKILIGSQKTELAKSIVKQIKNNL